MTDNQPAEFALWQATVPTLDGALDFLVNASRANVVLRAKVQAVEDGVNHIWRDLTACRSELASLALWLQDRQLLPTPGGDNYALVTGAAVSYILKLESQFDQLEEELTQTKWLRQEETDDLRTTSGLWTTAMSSTTYFHDTAARAALAAAERRLQRQSDEIDRLRIALDVSTAECARLRLAEPVALVALLRGVMEDDPGSISAAAGWLDEYDTDAPDLAANDAHVATTVAMERGLEIGRLLAVIATMRQDRRELDAALSDAEHRLTQVADARGHGLGC